MAEVSCAAVDCPWNFSPPAPGAPEEKCVSVQESVDQCCSSRACGAELEGRHQCTDGNRTYYEGETFTPESDSCRTCICKPGYEAGGDNSEFCYWHNCYVNYDDKLKRGCVPAFHPEHCCPWEWVCPDDDEVANVVNPVRAEEEETGSCGKDVAEEPAKTRDDCLLTRDLNKCGGNKERFYFDSNTRKCESYEYQGALEEGNVFRTKESCESTCADYLLDEAEASEEGCRAEEEKKDLNGDYDRCLPRARFRFNKATKRCEDFSFMGCGRNSDSYRTLEECEAKCVTERADVYHPIYAREICYLGAERGHCYGRMTKYHYDKESGVCKPFFYSGCGGNQNNFGTEAECLDMCITDEVAPRALAGFKPVVKDPCDQELEAGECRGKVPAYFYHKATRTCRLFFYSGCGGTDNRFSTLGDCLRACPATQVAMLKMRDVCLKPKESGECRASKRRFYYNKESGRCEMFVGCDAMPGAEEESNNFATRDECLLRCQFSLKNGGVIRNGPIIKSGNKTTLPAEAEGSRTGGSSPFITVGSGNFTCLGQIVKWTFF